MQKICEITFKKSYAVPWTMCSSVTITFYLVSTEFDFSVFHILLPYTCIEFIFCILFCFSFISYLDVTYLSLCASSYPTVLAFSFLNELMKEFITVYSKTRIEHVIRPYSFLEFGTCFYKIPFMIKTIFAYWCDLFSDNFIHKTCQRYNKPQSLTTRINLSELSLEMKLRPPYVVKLEEIEPQQNGYTRDIKLPYTGTFTVILVFFF